LSPVTVLAANFVPVIVALTILFALIEVAPSFGPVIAPSAMSVTEIAPSAIIPLVTFCIGIILYLY
jgi:hypothetical protein